MRSSTKAVTLYATQYAGDRDVVLLFKEKPVVTIEPRSFWGKTGVGENGNQMYGYRDQRATVVDRPQVYSLTGKDFRKLTGSARPKIGEVLTIKLTPGKTSRTKKTLFAAQTVNGIELFIEKPEFKTTEVYIAGSYGPDSEWIESRYVNTLRADPQSDAVGEFCVSGFQEGTGLRVPKTKALPLVVQVTA